MLVRRLVPVAAVVALAATACVGSAFRPDTRVHG
jgi:hypothetical protein